MDAAARAAAYFDAWNARDAEAIVATFADGGTYTDPTTNGPLTGSAIGAYASGLWQAFRDLKFEIRGTAQTAADKVVAEWTMIGTNTGSFAGRAGGRGITISAWEKPENTKQLMRGGAHRQAMTRFWTELGDAAFTSVWAPEHINPLWVRCSGCDKMSDSAKAEGRCACGAALPEPPAYF